MTNIIIESKKCINFNDIDNNKLFLQKWVDGMDILLTDREDNAEIRKRSLESLLDFVAQEIAIENAAPVMSLLFDGLREIYLRTDASEWPELAQICIDRPLASIIHQDPLTHRSFYKPRGYAGDAVLLDYIYCVTPPPGFEKVFTPLAKAINEFLVKELAALAVSARRRILAESIDAIAVKVNKPRILAVAAGHLREAELSQAIQDGKIGELIALDQDKESLVEVKRCYGKYGIQSLNSSIRPLLTGKHNLGKFDLIYVAGLYDYLDHAIACRLTAKLFGMLNSGGELLVSNFLPNVPAVGYMESYMGWYLLKRTPEELRAVSAEIEPPTIAETRIYIEENQNIVFMNLTKI